ncbi:NDP-hexose-3-ketoreductase [Hamadaea flava]|uniref:Gfo/Idh/MocA family protein n=1 Tax=Hamadaea flava TaxID=1742688 RepID=A0ABV8LN87_9ACTN|nr:Gfo/Idh/MocA family oxidoreductase [Hamadaea flava]MCP2329565.1 NDP-hexose-3-ketoreductase [Hamadaea flava]
MGHALRLGVLGCADIAERRTLPAAATVPGIEIAAIASRDAAKAQRLCTLFGGRPVAGYDALLARNDVDAVYIPLPPLLHRDWVDKALRAGKHVLAEKPLTTSRVDAAALFALAEEQRLVLLENYMFLHHSQHTHVRDLLAQGAIGAVREFCGAFTIPPRPAGDIRNDPRTGDGALLDIGGYPIRAAAHFLPGPLAVRGAVMRTSTQTTVVTGGSILLGNDLGMAAQLTFGMEHSYVSRYEFRGSTGRLWLDRAFTPPPDLAPVVHLETADGTRTVTLPPDDQFANVLAAFAAAVTAGSTPPPWRDGSIQQATLIDQVARIATVVPI